MWVDAVNIVEWREVRGSKEKTSEGDMRKLQCERVSKPVRGFYRQYHSQAVEPNWEDVEEQVASWCDTIMLRDCVWKGEKDNIELIDSRVAKLIYNKKP